jgi:hypothetical protein
MHIIIVFPVLCPFLYIHVSDILLSHIHPITILYVDNCSILRLEASMSHRRMVLLYVHRYLRLTPIYAMVLAIYILVRIKTIIHTTLL